MWISESGLYLKDKAILESKEWLTDSIIVAVQNMLKKQTEGRIVGWQSTQLCKRKEMFKPLPLGVPFVQVLNMDEIHWITTSNVKSTTKSVYDDTVNIYDSNWSLRSSLSLPTIQNICSFLKSPAKKLLFQYIDILRQENSSDCGVYALANATELALGGNPQLCNWEVEKMRGHVIACLEKGYMAPFPKKGKRCVGFSGGRKVPSTTVALYCVCRMPNDGTKHIQCQRCLEWFHLNCVQLDPTKCYRRVQWSCAECTNFMHSCEV